MRNEGELLGFGILLFSVHHQNSGERYSLSILGQKYSFFVNFKLDFYFDGHLFS